MDQNRAMSRWRYELGLHDLGDGCYAYLQPDGSWGWSNAGLVAGGDASLLVDTLFDLKLTEAMLTSMRAVTTKAPIRMLVNTHANGDHCWGNELVTGAEIIASKACAEEMTQLEPAMMATLLESEGLGVAGDFLRRCFARFSFADITLTPPTRTFEGRLDLSVGGHAIELIEVGPAHTRGDVLIHVPGSRTVFTGDILFIDGTPIAWEGPISNWIAACDRIIDLAPETVVPGHGPITDVAGVAKVREYFAYLTAEAHKRFDAGMSVEEAVRDIVPGAFSGWGEQERVVVNVDTLYREFRGDPSPPDVMRLFGLMGELARPAA